LRLRLLVTGGGTGGHVYPALAIVGAVREEVPDLDVLYVGTTGGFEADIVPRTGLPFRSIPSGGIVGKRLLGAFSGAAAALRGVFAARAVIREFRPHVVVGTGGYVSGPVALAARLERVPLVIHESDAFPGLTNRLASRWAAAVGVPFAEAKKYFPARAPVVVTGNPIRRSVVEMTAEEGRRILRLPDDARLIYIVGGSRGAQVLNQAAAGALPGWLALPGVRVLFVTGTRYHGDTVRVLETSGVLPGEDDRLTVIPYLQRAEAAFAAAEVVVTRAGASTLAELTARGVPAVIIPSPNVTHNHQDYNAGVLEKAGAARVIRENELSSEVLAKAVSLILEDGELRERMRQAARSIGRPDAASDLARLVLDAARGGRARRDPGA